jgi:hypothetical protein
MAHDEHFLQRLDRVDREHVDLALGLYRDHELVRFILSHARLAEGAERVAIALEQGSDSPHLVVAKTGAFVTCLGPGMNTGALPIVTRAHLDALASKWQHIREGLELAKKRGVNEARLLDRIESAGAAVSREDFVAASAMLGPAVPLLFGVFSSWSEAVEELHPLLQSLRRVTTPKKIAGERQLARGVWAMAHSSMILIDSASRDWVRDWAAIPELATASPWTALTAQSALPFVVRSAWLAGRLGKPILPSYKARFSKPSNALDLREAAWGLLCIALRHAALRSEALRVLRSAPHSENPPQPAGVEASYPMFAQLANLVEAEEESLRAEGLALGRKLVVALTCDLPDTSPVRFVEPDEVPEDLALPALLGTWHDAHNGERGGDVTLVAVVAAARVRAESFYYPASLLRHALPDSLESQGASLVAMQQTLLGTPKTVRSEERPGRNDACPCGSGKKYKKCHGR